MRRGIAPKSPEVGGEAGCPHTSAATPAPCMSCATEGHAVKGMLGTICYTSTFGTQLKSEVTATSELLVVIYTAEQQRENSIQKLPITQHCEHPEKHTLCG